MFFSYLFCKNLDDLKLSDLWLSFLPYIYSFKLDYLYVFKLRLFTSVLGLRNSFWKVERIVAFHGQRLTTTANDIKKVLKIFKVFLLTHALFHLMLEIIDGRKCKVSLKILQSDWWCISCLWVTLIEKSFV